jgi:hypothetical protein
VARPMPVHTACHYSVEIACGWPYPAARALAGDHQRDPRLANQADEHGAAVSLRSFTGLANRLPLDPARRSVKVAVPLGLKRPAVVDGQLGDGHGQHRPKTGWRGRPPRLSATGRAGGGRPGLVHAGTIGRHLAGCTDPSCWVLTPTRAVRPSTWPARATIASVAVIPAEHGDSFLDDLASRTWRPRSGLSTGWG